jgi:dynein heavy chain
MYQYSLESFQFFFTKAINATDDFSNDEDRVLALREKIRIVIYEWVARGLYEKHKQIFYTQLTLRLMQKGILPSEPYKFDEVQFLMKCTPKLGGSNPISDWLPDTAWYSVQRMIDLEEFKAFGENLVSASTRFKEWYNDLEPEITQLPLDWKKLAGPGKYFLKLLVIRSMRPDRISPALNKFIRDALPNGPKFVDLDAGKGFSDILKDTFNNSSPSTPIFFVLSPGADPIQDVMRLGKYKDGPTYELNKNFWDMAMGQGMEKDAEKKLEQAHKEGHWVMLENIHLMPKWLKILEKKLDDFAFEASHANFRLFLSAEPSTDIPIGILERCIKLTNEPPQGMRMNMLRAFTFFNKDEIEEKDAKIKTVLFALCFFHAVVIERKRFGPIGWNNVYPFNMGDLRDSSIVLNNYMERDQGSANKLPWDDLRYIFGEIMYGGHITDDWDRRLCKNYLEYMMKQELLEESDLVPYADPKSNIQFKCPLNLTHDLYVKYIEENIKTESPMLYGLHPNAEIGYRTQYCKDLFTTLQDLQPRDSSSGVEDINLLKADRFKELKMKIETDVGDTKLSVEDIKSGLSDEDRGPYQNVFLLECEYMNILTAEITKSITELELAFNGQLSMTDRLEQLVDYIYLDKVPEPWAKVAYPSERGLISWIDNLKLRLLQLNEWKDSPTTIPKIVYLNRLFNPQSFLTAIKQVYSINKNEELNKLYIQTEITKKTYDQISTEIVQKNTEAAYCYGMHLEGARWEVNTNCMEESAPKKLFHALPITLCKAEKIPERAEGKEDKSLYMCPVYKTSRRGPTYVFTAQCPG